MTDPQPGNTLALTIQPVGAGYPAIVDAAFTSAITAASHGGQGTQDYFDSENQTATFWDLVASQDITFAPGVDPLGRAVAMASSGNVELRIQAVWSGNADSLGVLTITTREVSGSGVSRLLTGTIRLTDNPSAHEIGEEDFAALLPAIYESAETMLVNLASGIADASRVESPDVDAESITAKALFATSQKAIGLAASLVEYGLNFTVVTWGQMIAESLGVSALMAVPMIVEFLGHRMQHSLQIENLLDVPVSWQLSTIHGEPTLSLPDAPIPARTTRPDPLAPAVSQTLAGELHQLFMNSTEWSSIGYVISVTPGSGSAQAQVLVNIPWAGDNVIWVGATSAPTESTWNLHAAGPSTLSTTTVVSGAYRVTVSLNRLSGEIDGVYFYCSTIVIQPA